MKAPRFSDAQKAFVLKQGADGVPVADICRKAGISRATVSATGIAACTFCYVARAGTSTSRRPTGFTASWACMRNKTPKRRVKAKLCDDRRPATAPNETWAMDFVHDQLTSGKKICAHGRRHVLALLAGDRSALQLSRGRRGRRLGARLRKRRLSEDDPRRSGLGVRLPRHGPVGVCPRRHAGLLTAWQADRQRLHRGLQRAVAGMPQRPLVPDA